VSEAARKHQSRDRDHLTSVLAIFKDEFDEGLLHISVLLSTIVTITMVQAIR